MLRSEQPLPFFLSDGDAFCPTEVSFGPWGDNLTGRLLGGLMSRGALADAPEGLRLARMTVDLVALGGDAPVTVRTSPRRASTRSSLIDVEIHQNGRSLAHGRALLLRPTLDAAGAPWSSDAAMPYPLPDGTPQVETFGTHLWSGNDASPGPTVGLTAWATETGPRSVWMRDHRPLVDDEELTGAVRATLAADIASPLSHWGPESLAHINSDYTLTLSREPVGTAIGMVGSAPILTEGIGTSTAILHDAAGPVGQVLVTTLAASVAPRIPVQG